MRVGRTGLTVAALCTLLVLAAGALSWRLSDDLIRFPVRSGESILKEEGFRSPADVGLPPPEEVTIPGKDVVLSGWLFRHPAPAGCGVVLSHGYQATRHQVLKFSPLFWAHGCHLLLPDAQHHGTSGGADFTWGARERYDLLEEASWLAAATGLPRTRIGLFGVSLGAAVSLQAAALAPDLAFVVADSTFSDLPAVVSARARLSHGRLATLALPGAFAVAALRARFDPWAVSPADDAAFIRIPVLLVHARGDDWFPSSHSEAVLARIPHARKALVVTDWGAEHGRSISARPGEYARMVDHFLATEAPGFGSAR